MSRARAVGWGATAEEPTWEQSRETVVAPLERFPVDTSSRSKLTPAAYETEPSHEPREPLPLAPSAAKPLQQYMAALVQRLFVPQERLENVVRSVVFAGVDNSRGSALLAAASAEVLASTVFGSVCLVDADFRAPSLHRLYGKSNEAGFAQVLTAKGQLREHVTLLAQGAENSLWLLPSGLPPDNDDSELTTEPNPARVMELLNAFDYVLFAAPRLTRPSLSGILGGLADGVVLVTEANVTRRHAARAAADTVRLAGGRVLGAVLNNRTFPIPEAVYRKL